MSERLDLWLTDDGWAIETIDGERIASGQITDNQDRVSLTQVLEDSGYKVERQFEYVGPGNGDYQKYLEESNT